MFVVFTHRADALLPLVGFPSLAIGEVSDAQAFFFPVQDIGIDSFLACDIVVAHKTGDFFLKLGGVNLVPLVRIVQRSPSHTLHLPTILGEGSFDPVDDGLKVQPQFVGVWLVLMFGHISFDVAFAKPVNGRFQEVLPIRCAFEVVATGPVCRTPGLAEMSLGVRNPRTGINGVAKLLLRQPFSSDIDGPEPPQLLTVRAATLINHQSVA